MELTENNCQSKIIERRITNGFMATYYICNYLGYFRDYL